MARILVVDDDRTFLATVKALLERDTHDVSSVETGSEGLGLLRSSPFDLVLVDIFMPRMDGFEMMSLARRSNPRTPVVVMSGRFEPCNVMNAPDFLRMGVELGAVASLRKPIRPDELSALVADCLVGSPGAGASNRPQIEA